MTRYEVVDATIIMRTENQTVAQRTARKPTLDGHVRLRIPEGTPSGKTFRVKGRGVRNGDLLVTVEVAVPRKLSKEAREALAALRPELEATRA